MTRANFEIITGHFHPRKSYFQGNSSCYPSYMLEFVVKACVSSFSTNAGAPKNFYPEIDSSALSELIKDCGLTLGQVGNPSYFYKLDFFNRIVTVYDTASRWVNAPVDWEAKGWGGVYKGNNGRMGYSSIIKGKVLFTSEFKNLVDSKGKIKKLNFDNDIISIVK